MKYVTNYKSCCHCSALYTTAKAAKVYQKIVAIKKTKKTSKSIDNRLASVMKSERYTLGYKTMLKSLRKFKEKLILLPTSEEIHAKSRLL
jgi:hypothetical protein